MMWCKLHFQKCNYIKYLLDTKNITIKKYNNHCNDLARTSPQKPKNCSCTGMCQQLLSANAMFDNTGVLIWLYCNAEKWNEVRCCITEEDMETENEMVWVPRQTIWSSIPASHLALTKNSKSGSRGCGSQQSSSWLNVGPPSYDACKTPWSEFAPLRLLRTLGPRLPTHLQRRWWTTCAGYQIRWCL